MNVKAIWIFFLSKLDVDYTSTHQVHNIIPFMSPCETGMSMLWSWLTASLWRACISTFESSLALTSWSVSCLPESDSHSKRPFVIITRNNFNAHYSTHRSTYMLPSWLDNTTKGWEINSIWWMLCWPITSAKLTIGMLPPCSCYWISTETCIHNPSMFPLCSHWNLLS